MTFLEFLTMTSIISWNVNGLQGILKKDRFGKKQTKVHPENPLKELLADHQPTIICLQEIRCSAKFDHLPHFSGYEYQYINYAKKKRGYSGTLVASKNKPLNVIYDFGVDDKPSDPGLNEEGRMITLEFDTYYLVNIYTPNSGVKTFARLRWRIEVWEVQFREHLSKLLKLGKEVVIIGDLNIIPAALDTSWKNTQNVTGATPEERAAFAELLKLGFVDVYRTLYPEKREYTWTVTCPVYPRTGHRMDLSLISSGIKYQDSQILDIRGSDHRPIKLTLA